MNVAGFENGSYQPTYEIGSLITIGGYTEESFVLTTFAGLLPDFINGVVGVHTIAGFATSGDETNKYHFSFNVKLNGTHTQGNDQAVVLWTKPAD